MDSEETYYDILRLPKNASISEIVAAYHAARAAFSKDSVAMYSLFSQDEAERVLSRLEEAYLTLSNIEKKREYDKLINSGGHPTEIPISMGTPLPSSPQSTRQIPSASPMVPLQGELPNETATDPGLPRPEEISGSFLKQMRERRSLSIEDVSRITKIPLRFLRAIEEEVVKDLPAKVYIQGFIKNLATLYKLEPETTARHFVSIIEAKKSKN